jgi:predicted pyridoxine 5'-phosphate oxidase superfamily flavin-nucleotide-binding protein
MLDCEVKEYAERSILCWLATVDEHGSPNVSPKEIFSVHGDSQFIIANIASPVSVRNILKNPKVCVSFIDVFVQKGFKLTGTAEVIAAGAPRFSELGATLLEMTRGVLPIRSIINIEVQYVAPILAPSYRLVTGTSEASQRESAMRTYGVKPREAE